MRIIKNLTRLSLSAKVFLGLALGILFGVFFGEMMSFLEIVGQAFVKLLQMTVLPYVMFSLIVALGRLTYSSAASLAAKCGLLLLLLLTLGISMVLTFPLMFPDWESASFFTTSITHPRVDPDFLGLYIPANLFFSLTNNVVPAVVVFSIAVGVALIGIGNKKGLMESLSVMVDALSRVTGFVVSLAPFGVFAIAASAAGTMSIDEFRTIQVYVVCYIAIALLLAFCILPGMVVALTSLRYRDVVGMSRDALITAFATGSVFVVLPILAEKGKALLQKSTSQGEGHEAMVDVIVPAAYSFPSIGTVLSLSFLIFAAWISGFPLSVSQYPSFAVTGLFSMFGGTYVAIPFMLDFLRIPNDTFQLFVVMSNVVIARFEALLSAMHTLVLALLGASAIAGRLRFRWKRLISFAALFVLSVLITILTVQIILTYGIKREYQGYRIFVEMDLLYEPTQAKVYKSLPPPPTLSTSSESRLDSILEKGVLRVGYKKDALPFVFTNDAGRLVGFDIEMAHMMARDMNFRLEFILVEFDEISQRLNQGTIDIMMGGLLANPGLAHKMYFSESYIDQTIAFIVKDHKREAFSYLSDVKNMEGLTVGVPKVQYFVDKVRSALPEAKIVLLDSSREFFTKKGPPLDALILSAEAGSAWSLIYPQYSVVVPQPLGVKLPTAFAMPRGDITLVKYVNTWIQDAKKSKRMQAIYNYWILGKKAVKKQPRWSVIRNVLHWVE